LKSKKLFAILTLVAFMMTLVPALAFGAVTYSATGTKIVDVENETLKAGKTATITVEFRDGAKKLLVSTPLDSVFVKTSKDGVTVTAKGAKADKTADSKVLNFKGDGAGGATSFFCIAELAADALYTNADGCIEFDVTSAFAEEFVISFWNDLTGADDEKSANKIGEATITFTSEASKVDNVSLSVSGDKAAGDEVTLTARVEDNQNNAVKGKTVTFYKKKGSSGSYSTIGTATTNSVGKAEFEYDETEAGDFYYKAKCGSSEVVSAKFTVAPGDPLAIKAITADGKIFDVDKDDNQIKFEVTDYYGNKITSAGKVKVSITSYPKGSDFEDDEDIDGADVYDNADEEIVALVTFDEVGDYTIKAKLVGSGIFTTVKVKAMEAGDAEEIIVKFQKDKARSLIASDLVADTLKLDVKLVDANGIEVDADDYKAYSSNVSLVKIDTIDSGELTLEGPKDEDKRGVATITVVDLSTGETASIDVPVVGQPYAIDVDYTVSGKTADVTLQFVDDEGDVTAAGADKDYELILPEGVSVSDKKVFDDESGTASFEATVTEYGTYELTAVSVDGIAKKFSIAVGEAEEVKTGGNAAVTMFIGSTGYVVDGVPMISDVSPFIKDGRTFVAVRPLANAFGVLAENIGWNEATQTVTLTRDDITVTIIIGSNDIQVVEDGVVTTVTADVPAFIENGRTVLPFRAVGEAFGATVSWDEATQSVTYEL